jgi:hypothetical protein
MLAAAAVLLDSVDSAAALVAVVLQEPAVRAPRVLVPLLVAAADLLGPEVLVLAQVPPELVLLDLVPLLLPQVVVESEVALHLQGRQSFSAAMARSSPPTVQPTYERAQSTRSPPKGRPCPSACRNWMPVRG